MVSEGKKGNTNGKEFDKSNRSTKNEEKREVNKTARTFK